MPTLVHSVSLNSYWPGATTGVRITRGRRYVACIVETVLVSANPRFPEGSQRVVSWHLSTAAAIREAKKHNERRAVLGSALAAKLAYEARTDITITEKQPRARVAKGA